MNARDAGEAGWVTVAAAAKALTDAGDQIDPSNVSRYLARFPEIPSRKQGKFRWVDLNALSLHRGGNVLVGEKRAARGVDEDFRAEQLDLVDVGDLDDEDDEVAAGGAASTRQVVVPSAINAANLRLKELQIAAKEREEAIEDGRFVPIEDVTVLINETLQTWVSELEREEASIAIESGRDVAQLFRRSRKAAQARAAETLKRGAEARLKAQMVDRAVAAMPALPADDLPEPAAEVAAEPARVAA